MIFSSLSVGNVKNTLSPDRLGRVMLEEVVGNVPAISTTDNVNNTIPSAVLVELANTTR